jgi:hypothetical protein
VRHLRQNPSKTANCRASSRDHAVFPIQECPTPTMACAVLDARILSRLMLASLHVCSTASKELASKWQEDGEHPLPTNAVADLPGPRLSCHCPAVHNHSDRSFLRLSWC